MDKYRAAEYLNWPTAISNLEEKQKIAAEIADRANTGQTIGIGSGTTAYITLFALADRITAESLDVTLVSSSHEISIAASSLGINTINADEVESIDWTVDGADEVDPDRRIIKGRGGAMKRERELWNISDRIIVAADQSKFVDRLGQKFAVPVEVSPSTVAEVAASIMELGASEVQLRVAQSKDGPVITESGNLILDVSFDEIPEGLDAKLRSIAGVHGTGLFEGYDNVEIPS